MERGIVRGRVASLLRSSEIKPYVLLICTFFCLPQKHPGSLGLGVGEVNSEKKDFEKLQVQKSLGCLHSER